MTQPIYLDNAATSPPAPEVVEAITRYYTTSYGNASSLHSHGREARQAVETSRGSIAERLGVQPEEIDYGAAVGDESKRLTLPGFYDDQATCYAVYDFLERFCAVRWYGPTALNTVIPKQTTLTVSGGDVRRSPGIRHRESENPRRDRGFRSMAPRLGLEPRTYRLTADCSAN